MRNIYRDGTYLSTHPSWHVEDSPYKARQILRMIKENHLEPSSIYEIGCGAGEILNQLYQYMPDYVRFCGYEISPHAFALCRTREKERLQFKLGDFLSDSGAHADLVLTIDVVEHVEDYMGFLGKLREKGEYHIFHIPLDISAQRVLRSGPILGARRNLGHLHYFIRDTALATLRDTGYEILADFYTSGEPNTLKSLLTKIPRMLFFKLDKDLTVRVLGGYSLMVLAR